MFQRPHWSYSSLNQYLRCPLQYFFERVLGLPKPTVGSGLVLGSAVHSALESYHRELMERHPPSRDHLRKTFLESWESRENESEVVYKKGETRTGAIEQGIALIDLYLEEPPPENIIAVEQRLLAPVQNSRGEYLEKPILSVADLITKENEDLKVNEFKTSGRAFSEMEAETSLQPTCYVNAIQKVCGQPAEVEYTVLVKTKTPKIQRLTTHRTTEDLGRLGDIVQTVDRAVEADIFYPVENPMNCSTCPYRTQCRDWGSQSRCSKHSPILEDAIRGVG